MLMDESKSPKHISTERTQAQHTKHYALRILKCIVYIHTYKYILCCCHEDNQLLIIVTQMRTNEM